MSNITPELAEKFAKKIQFKAIAEIDSNDLDSLINDYFGFSHRDGYESVAENEWSNDSQYSFKIKKENLDQWDSRSLEAAKIGKWRNISLRPLLVHLCNEGLIPECEFVVKVSW